MTFSAYCTCASNELLTKWIFFRLLRLLSAYGSKYIFAVKSASASGLNGPPIYLFLYLSIYLSIYMYVCAHIFAAATAAATRLQRLGNELSVA